MGKRYPTTVTKWLPWLLLLWMPLVWADGQCPEQQVLKSIGATPLTNDGTVSSTPAQVRLVTMTCGATACVGALEDGGKVMLEPGAIANATYTWPEDGFSEAPLYFKTNVIFVDDGNVAQVMVYSCQTP